MEVLCSSFACFFFSSHVFKTHFILSNIEHFRQFLIHGNLKSSTGTRSVSEQDGVRVALSVQLTLPPSNHAAFALSKNRNGLASIAELHLLLFIDWKARWSTFECEKCSCCISFWDLFDKVLFYYSLFAHLNLQTSFLPSFRHPNTKAHTHTAHKHSTSMFC